MTEEEKLKEFRKERLRKAFKKILEGDKGEKVYLPLEEVFLIHDSSLVLWTIFAISIYPDGSIRYTLRNGEALVDATADEMSYEPNQRIIDSLTEE